MFYSWFFLNDELQQQGVTVRAQQPSACVNTRISKISFWQQHKKLDTCHSSLGIPNTRIDAYARVHTLERTHKHAQEGMHTYTYVHTQNRYTNTQRHTLLQAQTNIGTHTNTCMPACMNAHICLHAGTHARAHTHTHTRTHTRTHVHTHRVLHVNPPTLLWTGSIPCPPHVKHKGCQFCLLSTPSVWLPL